MKTLVPQHSSLPFACWKEERCAGAAAPRDCIRGCSGWHTCQVQPHRRLHKERSLLQQHEGRGKNRVFLSLSWLYQPSAVRILPTDTWEPIKHSPVFLITTVNILEARSPASSDAAQITAILIPLCVPNFAHLQLLLRYWQERGQG